MSFKVELYCAKKKGEPLKVIKHEICQAHVMVVDIYFT